MKTLNLEYWEKVLFNLAKTFENEKEHLSRLDGAIGDGDHGISMVLGFQKITGFLAQEHFSDIGGLWKMAGNAFIDSVGGVTGIIFGTLFIKIGEKAGEKKEVDAADLAAMFDFALEGIKQRGKAREGEKSMVDALSPAVKSLNEAVLRGMNPGEALLLAGKSAEEGMQLTGGMMARVGRARYQGEKGIGHIDAGAASVALIFKVLADTATSQG